MDDRQIRVAGAPVSFGIFELTLPGTSMVEPDDLLASLATAGYEGVDLGPDGYLGHGAVLRARLANAGLALVGGWIQLRFSEASGFVEDLESMEKILDSFEAAVSGSTGVGANHSSWRPKPTLADAGSPARRAHPGGGFSNPELRLGSEEWRAFAARVQVAADAVREKGFEPTFHHHACTYVEAPQEIERLLELTNVGLCLDTGHLLLGGGDPVCSFSEWASRINHLHLKDCNLDVLRECTAKGADMRELWSRGVFCGLGAGDLDLYGFLEIVTSSGYEGWLVVEEDVIPAPGTSFEDLAARQARNRNTLRRCGI